MWDSFSIKLLQEKTLYMAVIGLEHENREKSPFYACYEQNSVKNQKFIILKGTFKKFPEIIFQQENTHHF